MCYVMNNFDKFKTNYNIHNLSTRNKINLFTPVNYLRLFQKGSYHSAIQIYNKLPDYIKLLCFVHKYSSFKNSLKNSCYLIFYSMDEFYNYSVD